MTSVIARYIEDAAQAFERMKVYGVRCIAVMDEKRKPIGIVCLDDLLRQLAADANALVEIMTREQRHEHGTRR